LHFDLKVQEASRMKPKITVAICTYNRCARLPGLVKALRDQDSPVPFEILIINNNSTDNTARVLQELKEQAGVPLRFVNEPSQGISYARNRAIEESLDSDCLLFLDDDEIPITGFVSAAIQCFKEYPEALCVGGKVKVDFSGTERPDWLKDELLGFLAETDYGEKSFEIVDETTPIWTANIAYRMKIFREWPNLRFDIRYNREGKAVGGGEDAIMFQALLKQGISMRYCPDMIVNHAVESWRLRRGYFLKLHYVSGFMQGLWELDEGARALFGVPLFLFGQCFRQTGKALVMGMRRKQGFLRQAMTAAHALGLIAGAFERWRTSAQSSRN
jgi:glycosyltransferase involved in cell wall biosynthesis